MALILVVLGFLLWLLTGWNVVGIILIVVGLILFFVADAPYGYGPWHGRGAPPP